MKAAGIWENIMGTNALDTLCNDITFIDNIRNIGAAAPVKIENNVFVFCLKGQIQADLLIKEWGKEFFMEGRRRSDLVRFGLFTGNKYIWAFKGGVAKGASVDKHYNVYPIPAKDISNNPGLTQNAGY